MDEEVDEELNEEEGQEEKVDFPDFEPPRFLEFLFIERNSPYINLLSSHFFINLGHIRLLKLDSCDFSNVPSDAFKSMQNLEALNVMYPHNFSHIEIKDLFKLKWLRLHLDINETIRFYQANPNLKVLDFRNASKNLHQMFNFRKLEAFTVCNRYDKRIDFDLDWLLGKHLDHFRPEINDFIDAIITSQTSSLRYLYLENFKSINGSFSSFFNLRTLKLSYISPSEFQSNMFKELVNLTSLDLSHNDFKYRMLIPTCFFNGLDNLKQLVMSECNLTRLPDGLFAPLSRLQLLNLSHNNLLEIDMNTFRGLEYLRELLLGNPFF